MSKTDLKMHLLITSINMQSCLCIFTKMIRSVYYLLYQRLFPIVHHEYAGNWMPKSLEFTVFSSSVPQPEQLTTVSSYMTLSENDYMTFIDFYSDGEVCLVFTDPSIQHYQKSNRYKRICLPTDFNGINFSLKTCYGFCVACFFVFVCESFSLLPQVSKNGQC